MFAPIPPKNCVSFPQEKKNFIRKFLECQSAQIYVLFVDNKGSFYYKTLISKPQKCTFLANLFFSKNPKVNNF